MTLNVDGVTVTKEWAVHSDDGRIYQVQPPTRAKAEHEAALLQQGVDGELGEPGAAPARRYVMTTPDGVAATGMRASAPAFRPGVKARAGRAAKARAVL